MATKIKRPGIKVPAPRARPKEVRLFPRSDIGINSKSNSYKKSALREDPSDFFNIGFGDTGLTGES